MRHSSTPASGRAPCPDQCRRTPRRWRATWLAHSDRHLATGGERGADFAFVAGAPAGRRTLYLPWPGCNGHAGPDCRTLSHSEIAACIDTARSVHPAWRRCSEAVRNLHARNASVILGTVLDRPVARRIVRYRQSENRHWNPVWRDFATTYWLSRVRAQTHA